MKAWLAIPLLVGSFFLGRIAADVWLDRGSDPITEAGHAEEEEKRKRLTAILPRSLGKGGASVFIAQRDRLSSQAIDLLEKVEVNRPGGGARFNAALAELSGAAIDQLVEELAALPSKTRKLRQLELLVTSRWVEADTVAKAREGNIQAIEALGRTDPVTAMQIADGLSDGSLALTYFREVFIGWSMRDPAAAVDYFVENDLIARQDFKTGYWAANLISVWAKTDGPAAAAFFESMPDGDAKSKALRYLTNTWAGSDPEAAFAWLEAQEDLDTKTREHSIASLVHAAREVDSDFVLGLVNSDEGLRVRGRALTSLAYHYGNTDPESALEWLGTLEGYDERSAATAGVLESLEPGDLAGLNQVVQSTPPAKQGQILERFATRWSEQNPEAVIAWASALDPRDRFAAAEGVITTLATGDEDATHHAELVAFVEQDASLHRNWADHLAGSWAQADPRAAFAWSQEIEWPNEQKDATSVVVSIWAQKDRLAAREEVHGAQNLSESLRAELLKRLAE